MVSYYGDFLQFAFSDSALYFQYLSLIRVFFIYFNCCIGTVVPILLLAIVCTVLSGSFLYVHPVDISSGKCMPLRQSGWSAHGLHNVP